MIAGLFVDGANVSSSLNRTYIARIDYGKLGKAVARRMAMKVGEPVNLCFRHYYRAVRPQEATPEAKRFAEALTARGWTEFARPAKQYSDGHWEDKGVDLQIALDAYDLAVRGQIGALAIMSHDTDFVALFEKLPRSVKRFVVGWEDRMGVELKDVACPIYVWPMWKEIELED